MLIPVDVFPASEFFIEVRSTANDRLRALREKMQEYKAHGVPRACADRSLRETASRRRSRTRVRWRWPVEGFVLQFDRVFA